MVSKWKTWREFPCFAVLYGDMWKIFHISSLLCRECRQDELLGIMTIKERIENWYKDTVFYHHDKKTLIILIPVTIYVFIGTGIYWFAYQIERLGSWFSEQSVFDKWKGIEPKIWHKISAILTYLFPVMFIPIYIYSLSVFLFALSLFIISIPHNFIKLLRIFIRKIGRVLLEAVKLPFRLLRKLLPYLADLLEYAGRFLWEAIKLPFKWLRKALSYLADFLEYLWDKIYSVFKWLHDQFAWLTSIIKNFAKWFVTSFKYIWDVVKNVFD